MNELIKIDNGQAVTSSRQVAESFGKLHKDVLESVRNIGVQVSTAEFSALFFKAEYAASNGKMNPEYLMNRDGFTLLAMGFTGSEAMQWKIKYIQAFNEMEKQISTSSQTLSIQSKAKNAEARLLNAKRKDAEFLLMVAKQHGTLSPESRELLTINAVERLTGEGFLPRPKVDKLYTATEIGKELGISSNMVGRIANANNLKTSDYGLLVLDKSKHSVKQVDTFMYREAGKEEIIRLFKKMNVS
jgi:Rha family phage regulatory protein